MSLNNRGIIQTESQFNDPSFPAMSISKYAATKLDLAEDKVIDALYSALPAGKQNDANKELIEKAMKYKVNASGAIILMVNTNEGMQLVYANSQRRKKVVSSNGACEEKESMAETAVREFSEEIGNPDKKGILNSIISNINNCRSIEVTNKIGNTAADIANRIVEQLADKGKLYINMSSLYVNESPVNIRALTQEIEALNVKLQKSAPYYNQAVTLIFGDKNAGINPANLADPTSKESACKIINDFKENCQSNITPSFSAIFGSEFNETTNSSTIKEALSAIVDLTENNALGLIPKDELTSLLSLDLNQKDVKEKFKKDFFAPSFENILAHKGKKSPGDFISGFEKLSSTVSKSSTGTFSGHPSPTPSDASSSYISKGPK